MAYPGQPGQQGYAQPGQQGYAQPGYGQQNALATQPMSGLQITTSFFPLQWFLYFKRPALEINGQQMSLSWGTETIPLAPGQYNMRLFVPGLLFPSFVTHAALNIYPNYVTGMTWDTPLFVFMSGNLRELGYKPWGS